MSNAGATHDSGVLVAHSDSWPRYSLNGRELVRVAARNSAVLVAYWRSGLRRRAAVQMRHRLIALVIAFAVAAAPSLVGACEISCATTEAAGVMSPQHACHHQVAAPVNAPSLVSLHGCAHVDGLPVTAAEKVVSVATLPVNSVAASEIAVAIAPVVRAPWDAPPRPPDRSIRTTQLRI